MRLKDKIIIAFIVMATIFLAFLPALKDIKNNNSDEVLNDNINITIQGEINALNSKGELTNKMTISLPSGISYGFIISKIDIYLTKYSKIDDDLTKRYYADSIITIESNNKSLNEENKGSSGKICINKASKTELMRLNGIKEGRAIRIIEYRKNKKIESYTELKRLLGLSDDAIEEIKKQAFL